MPTIKDVAKLAGVSFTTVSHVLNSSRPVSDQARECVQEAVRQLNYVPNAAARALRRQATGVIGVVLTDAAHPFFAELARAIEKTCFLHRYTLVLGNSYDDAARQDAYFRTLLEVKRVDGLIVAAVGNVEVVARRLGEVRVPVVLVDRHVPNVDADTVQVDHERAAYLATRHLLELGHRRIGCVVGPFPTSVFSPRVDGYRRALAGAGLAPPAEGVAEAPDVTLQGGYAAAERLLRPGAGLTAIFVCGDLLAMGALRCAAERGIAVPRDVSIIGLDGVEVGQCLNPALTSVAQPTQRLGELAVTCLLDRIRYGQRRPIRDLRLAPELTVRASTGPAPP